MLASVCAHIRIDMHKCADALHASACGRSQAFKEAWLAFNQNLASWNVLRVLDVSSSFDSTSALSTSTKATMYLMWGATLQVAYPTWACGNAGMLTCITNANIATAVTAWVTSPSTAATAYGPIGYWNTAAVTSMVSLFSAKSTFNDDISKWNVASVSNMYEVRLDSVWTAYSFSYVSRLHLHTYIRTLIHAHTHARTHARTRLYARIRIYTCM